MERSVTGVIAALHTGTVLHHLYYNLWREKNRKRKKNLWVSVVGGQVERCLTFVIPGRQVPVAHGEQFGDDHRVPLGGGTVEQVLGAVEPRLRGSQAAGSPVDEAVLEARVWFR